MEVKLVAVGNSRGIRIPKALIEECGLGDTVELYVDHNRLIIAPHRWPREGWRESFARAAQAGPRNTLLLEGVVPNQFDEEEWTW
jgi:antitoxin MazE